MAHYVVGDLHGCLAELQLLLNRVNFDYKKDLLFCAGDLVARGSQSLETVRFIKSLGDRAFTVLGNHDMYLLGMLEGAIKIEEKCIYVKDFLNAEDRLELQNWLRTRPLAVYNEKHNFLLVHAGINPKWDLKTSLSLAKWAENKLQGEDYKIYLQQMCGDEPNLWQEDFDEIDKWRIIVNSFTRMRLCADNGALELTSKTPPPHCPKGLLPWFELVEPKDYKIIFGHWAKLAGNTGKENIIGLDTGCAWGNYLTMLCLETGEVFTQNKL